jgi:Fe-S-cluster containining protein
MKCKRCGTCCKFLDVVVSFGYDEVLAEFYKARGLKVVYTDKDQMAVEIPQRCPHLRRAYKGTIYSCAIYDKRPELCREWVCK